MFSNNKRLIGDFEAGFGPVFGWFWGPLDLAKSGAENAILCGKSGDLTQ